tara:strand:+ start:5569 stop:7755 length:2187 start_codon:yes stop_codon:yes gene_type:complete
MIVGIIQYPGSNCDNDMFNYFNNWFEVFYIWHKEKELNKHVDLIIIPGGFAFGDRVYNKATDSYIIDPGEMAIKSNVTQIILNAAKNKIPILGICNGFQILTKLNLLPGQLEINKNKKFNCKKVNIKAFYDNNIYNTSLYIANTYGRYKISQEEENDLLNKQIFLKYDELLDEVDSYKNIAGICNKDQTIFGMMPHPERNNSDFKSILLKILFPKNQIIETQILYNNKIKELMNSEHISYKSSKKYLKTLHTKEKWVIQGPGENAGIVDIGDNYCIAVRIESHNHPTYIDPFEGAATGVGGIMRDIFTMGARPIAIMDFLRFGNDENSKILMNEAINGISYYGNCVGVANIGGDCYIHESYNKNPLVNVACIGIVKKENIIYGNAENENDLLIYVGSKTGNEGIGGATMASQCFDNIDNNNINNKLLELKKNVQKSDPYLEKLLLESCCEIAEKKLAVGMQDMGAGGLLCASYEVVFRGREKYNKNLGCMIHLDKVPLKHEMDNLNILISESQERMLIIAKPENKEEIFNIFEKWDLECSIIGEVTNDGIYCIKYNNNIQYREKLTYQKDIYQEYNKELEKSNKLNNKLNNKITKLKNNSLWEVYDSTIGNRTIKGPDSPGSYSILDIPEVNKKLLIKWVSYSIKNNSAKIIELLHNFNAKPLCIVNCLNYGDPNNCINDLINFIQDLNNFCKANNIPVVGGNVSLYNSTNNLCIEPTPIIVLLALIN